MINSIFVAKPKKASSLEFKEAINIALNRAKTYRVNIGVFEARDGVLHIQNLSKQAIKFFGKRGILYATQIQGRS
jgi:hypothetical protein